MIVRKASIKELDLKAFPMTYLWCTEINDSSAKEKLHISFVVIQMKSGWQSPRL